MADLHLLVDGVRIEPATRGPCARFAVPTGAEDVWLVCNTSRPVDIGGPQSDVRQLGVCLKGLSIDDGFTAPRTLDLTDPLFCIGFHGVEDGHRRWTAGRARLPAALWVESPDGFFLRVDLAGPAVPRWAAPASRNSTRYAHPVAAG